jgi:Flp pilus assembly pilin Flp
VYLTDESAVHHSDSNGFAGIMDEHSYAHEQERAYNPELSRGMNRGYSLNTNTRKAAYAAKVRKNRIAGTWNGYCTQFDKEQCMNHGSRSALKSATRKFIKNRQGATMVEYAILLALVLLVAYKGFGALGGKVAGSSGASDKAFATGQKAAVEPPIK